MFNVVRIIFIVAVAAVLATTSAVYRLRLTDTLETIQNWVQ